MIKKAVIIIPITATRTAGLLKLTSDGVAEELAVIEARPFAAPLPETL